MNRRRVNMDWVSLSRDIREGRDFWREQGRLANRIPTLVEMAMEANLKCLGSGETLERRETWEF